MVCVSILWGAFLGALGLNALYGRENDGFSGPTAAQWTVLGGLHDRVGFSLRRLREIDDPLNWRGRLR